MSAQNQLLTKSKKRKLRQNRAFSKLVDSEKSNAGILHPNINQLIEEVKQDNSSVKKAINDLANRVSSRTKRRELARYDISKIQVADGLPRLDAQRKYNEELVRIQQQTGLSLIQAKALLALDDWKDIASSVIPLIAQKSYGYLRNLFPKAANVVETVITNDKLDRVIDTKATDFATLEGKRASLALESGSKSYYTGLIRMLRPDAVNVDALASALIPNKFKNRIPSSGSLHLATYPLHITRTFNFLGDPTGNTGILINPDNFFMASAQVSNVTYYIEVCTYSPAGGTFTTTTPIFTAGGPANAQISNFGEYYTTGLVVEIECLGSFNNNQGMIEGSIIVGSSSFPQTTTASTNVSQVTMQSSTYYQCNGINKPMTIRFQPRFQEDINISTTASGNANALPLTDGIVILITGAATSAPFRLTIHQTVECTNSWSNGAVGFVDFQPADPGSYTIEFLNQLYAVAPHISALSQEHCLGLVSALRNCDPCSCDLMMTALEYLGSIHHHYQSASYVAPIETPVSEISFTKMDGY